MYESQRRLTRTSTPVHQGYLRCRIGSLPVSYDQTNDSNDPTQAQSAPASEVINANISDYVFTGMKIRYVKEHHYKFVTYIPVQEDNEYDDILTINMLCDNFYENYWALHRYLETIQSGQTDAFPILDMNNRIYGYDHRYRNRLSYIPFIDIHCGDDTGREHQILRFERCRGEGLSSPQITPGHIDTIKFTASFKFENIRIIRLPDPNELMSAICVASGL